jgi:hypothetical protein
MNGNFPSGWNENDILTRVIQRIIDERSPNSVAEDSDSDDEPAKIDFDDQSIVPNLESKASPSAITALLAFIVLGPYSGSPVGILTIGDANDVNENGTGRSEQRKKKKVEESIVRSMQPDRGVPSLFQQQLQQSSERMRKMDEDRALSRVQTQLAVATAGFDMARELRSMATSPEELAALAEEMSTYYNSIKLLNKELAALKEMLGTTHVFSTPNIKPMSSIATASSKSLTMPTIIVCGDSRCSNPRENIEHSKHACDIDTCGRKMHAFCGAAVFDKDGEVLEGFGAPRRCDVCVQKYGLPTPNTII